MTDVADSSNPAGVAKEDGTTTGQADASQDIPTAGSKSDEADHNIEAVKSNGDKKPEVPGDDVNADGDSEAETLIQSPEKKRGLLANAPILKPSNDAAAIEKADETAIATDLSKKSRKRKRGNDDGEYEGSSQVSSPASSPLSSPVLHPRSQDSDSEASNQSGPRSARSNRVRRNVAKAESEGGQEDTAHAKTRKRRPSDILPPSLRHRGGKGHSNSVDTGTSERRETRSATYPRHSDDDRSPSPRPASKREHRRGVSTQLTSGELERKKRGRPPTIITRRNRSVDRAKSSSSDESSSPQRIRPSLPKFTSQDHDAMSPAKMTGPRKPKDKNGRTLLSRACNNRDIERARACLLERPEEINEPDNAGNTPLQIAALEGFADIVRFLLENGAEVDTRNIDKETPLIDAVENGHVGVVKLLLDFGANPRLGNAKGDEPFDLIAQGDEHYKVIRKLISDAKEHDHTKRRRSYDNRDEHHENSSRAASATSARDSPPLMGPRSPPALTSRRRTGRSEVTRKDLLWQPNTQENLRLLAAKGNVQGVANILNILSKADTESVIAAAKAGHDEVLNYLLAMGEADPDPEPVTTLRPGSNTPMLAAIGKTNPAVVKLLVDQSKFDPTKKYKGKTYYEIAAERKGQYWEKEYDILKTAYDNYAGGKRKTASPRKVREKDMPKEKKLRRSMSPPNLRHSSSPTMMHKGLPLKSPRSAQKERRVVDGQQQERQKPSISSKGEDEATIAVASDQDQTVAQKRSHKQRRSQSDAGAPPDLETDATHRRRRLVTGAEHRRQKSAVAGSVSDAEGSEIEVKRENQTPGLKRSRGSMSPESSQTKESDVGRVHVKKRRTIHDSSPEEARPGPKRKASVAADNKKDVNMQDAGPSTTVLDDVNELFSQHKRRRSQQHSRSHTPVGPNEAEPMRSVVTDTISDEPTAKTEALEAPAPQTVSPVPIAEPEPTIEEKAAAEAHKREEEERLAEEARRAEEARVAAEKAEMERKAEEEAEARRKAEEEAATLRKREEEERQERVKRELEDRQRRQEEQIRQQHLEIERRRREALPAALCRCALMLDADDTLYKTSEWLSRFLPLFTVRTKQLETGLSSNTADEEWVPNFQVAVLLATKDMKLANYTSIDKRPVRPAERDRLWKVARQMLSYEYVSTGLNTSVKQAVQREEQERPKFYAMSELFWVKVRYPSTDHCGRSNLSQLSDFEDQVIRQPHLASLQLKRQPISLRSHDFQALGSPPPQTNGIKHGSPQIPNGIYSTMPGALYPLGNRV